MQSTWIVAETPCARRVLFTICQGIGTTTVTTVLDLCRPHLILQVRDERLAYVSQVRRITAACELYAACRAARPPQ